MIQLFEMGGPLFMSLVTIPFVAACALIVRAIISIMSAANYESIRKQVSVIRSLGLLALILGILGQAIGLFSAFEAIEGFDSAISPQFLAGGLKVSSITTIWGLICYVLVLLSSVLLESFSSKSEQSK